MAKSRAPLAEVRPPNDAIRAVTRDAVRDADAVAALLDQLGFRRPGPGDPPVRLPAQFLLGLGVAARLFLWESKGLFAHHATGIPSAEEVLHDVVRRTARLGDTGPDPAVVALWARVLDLSVGRVGRPADAGGRRGRRRPRRRCATRGARPTVLGVPGEERKP